MKQIIFLLSLTFLSIQVYAQKQVFQEFNDSLKLIENHVEAIADIATWNNQKYLFIGGGKASSFFQSENYVLSIQKKDSLPRFQTLSTKMRIGKMHCRDMDLDGNQDECLIFGYWWNSDYTLSEGMALFDYNPNQKKWELITDTLPSVSEVHSLYGIDLDSDGDEDYIITGNKYTPKSTQVIYLFENTTSGGKIALHTKKAVGLQSYTSCRIEVLNCNNQRKVVAITNPKKNEIEFHKQDSFGSFSLLQKVQVPLSYTGQVTKVLNRSSNNEDLIVSIAAKSGTRSIFVLRNHIDSFIVDTLQTSSINYKGGDIAIYDLDNDGLKDYIGMGYDGNNNKKGGLETLLDSSGTYVPRPSGMGGGEKSRIVMHDIDENGYIDVLTYFGDNGWRVQLGYSNYGIDTFAPPSAPSVPKNLQSKVVSNTATLSCDSSKDNLTPTAGLQYAVRVWRQGSPNRYIRSGLYPNMGHQTRMLVTGLNWGWHYYQFRSVDPGENWSGWSKKDSFYIEKIVVLTNPVDTNIWRCSGDSVIFITEWDTTQGTPDSFSFNWIAKTGDTTRLSTNLTGKFGIQADSTSTGKYFVTAWNTRNTDTSGVVEVNLFTKTPAPKLSDTTICNGNTAIFTVKDSMLSYHWSTSDTTRSIQVVKSGTIHVSTVDTNGCQVDTSNVVTITVKSLPLVDLGNNISVCSGDSVQLKNQSIDVTIVSYHWSTADTTSSIWSTGGKHSLIVTDTLGCTNADSVMVSVNKLPSLSVQDTFQMCLGDSVKLVASSMDSISAFQWISNNKSVNTSTFTIVDEGVYKIEVTDTNGCKSSDSTYVDHYPTPIKPTLTGNNTMCPGDSLVLSSSAPMRNHWSTGDTTSHITSSDTGTVQLWQINKHGCSSDTASIELSYLAVPDRPVFNDTNGCVGDTIRLDFHNSIKWSNGDSGSVTISTNTELVGWQVSSYGCVSDQDTLSIRIHQKPPTPEIHGVNDSLYTFESELKHEWFYEDSLIISASVSWIKAKNKGNYRTLVKNQYGCVSDTSDAIMYTPVGINNSNLGDIKLYPNPAKNWVTIETKTEVTNIVLYNASGQKIKDIDPSQKRIDVSHLPNGLYYAVIEKQGNSYIAKFVKNGTKQLGKIKSVRFIRALFLWLYFSYT